MRTLIIFIALLTKILADTPTNSRSLDLINAGEAYKQGITGEGVNVGILDTAVNKNHISLKNKIDGDLTTSASNNGHGSHVAGIIAGEKLDGSKPHGVAYGARLYSGQIIGERGMDIPKFTDFFANNKVKIINNSWNETTYPFVGISGLSYHDKFFYQGQGKNADYFLDTYLTIPYAREIVDLSRTHQTLLVFASGNEGIISSGVYAILPSFDEDLRAFVNVGSLNSSHISRNGDELVVNAKGVSDFSNAFYKAENYSLMAFGHQINSADGGNVNGYTFKSGTSMATPMVSGAAALVAQKFPFLNGKQIADILLSTANKEYKAPKLVVKNSGKSILDPYYTIIYIDNTPPTNNAQIKQDLIAEGYTEAEAQSILQNLISNKIKNNYSAITQLSRESVFGQGILDIKKALGGLSILDANRLNDKDKQTLKDNTQELYYSLDTQGNNAEFSNNIEQKQWDDKLHYNGAKNLPTHMQNLNVGFIKEGSGELTLSGRNTYQGFTIIKNGALRLKRSNNKGGELTASSVFVEENGTLSGNGIIHKNLTNRGIVRPGNQDLTDLEVKEKYTQSGLTSRLQLDFGKNKNSKLIAKTYDIQSGILEYIPLPQFFNSGEYVKIELGGLSDSLSRFTEVKVKENNAMTFQAVLGNDKLSINNPPVSTTPQSPSISSDTPSDTTPPSSVATPNPLLGVTPPNVSDELIVLPTLKEDAYNTPNSNMGNVLREIRNDQNLSENYKGYFALLDSDKNSTQILESLEGKSFLGNAASNVNNSLSATQNNMLFAINPTITASLAFNIDADPQYLASVNSDSLTDSWNFLELSDKNFFWYLSPSYKKINGDGNKGYASGIDLGIGKDVNKDLRTTLSVKYSDTTLDFNGSDFDSKNMSAGVNAIYNLENFKLLNGAFLNYGFNKMQRNILGSSSSINADYNNLALALQMGIAKDLELQQNLTLTPLMYFNYAYFHQETFKESGELFSKTYEAINHHTTSLASGLNLSYSFEDKDLKHTLSGFGMYEYRLSGRVLKNKARFNDFITQSFTQQNELNKYFVSLGVSYYLAYRDYFFNLSFVNELAKRENNMRLSGSFGLRF